MFRVTIPAGEKRENLQCGFQYPPRSNPDVQVLYAYHYNKFAYHYNILCHVLCILMKLVCVNSTRILEY